MTISASDTLFDRLSRIEQSTEDLCVLRLQSGLPVSESVLYLQSTEDGAFSGLTPSTLFSRFSRDSLRFLAMELHAPTSHYALLLTSDRRPVLAATLAARYGGLCLLIALKATPEVAVAFLETIPSIRCSISPEASSIQKAATVDPTAFATLGLTFRTVFSLFESLYSGPTEYHDPIKLFSTMQMKLRNAATLFGINAEFLFQRILPTEFRRDLSFDLDLFSATTILLFAAARLYSLENRIHIVFMEADRCPATCIHFRVDSEEYANSRIRKLLDTVYAQNASFFDACMGEHARKEAEKIPGVGHMILNDRYAAFGDHALNVFAPVSQSWADFTLRCPLLVLPDRFYAETELPSFYRLPL